MVIGQIHHLSQAAEFPIFHLRIQLVFVDGSMRKQLKQDSRRKIIDIFPVLLASRFAPSVVERKKHRSYAIKLTLHVRFAHREGVVQWESSRDRIDCIIAKPTGFLVSLLCGVPITQLAEGVSMGEYQLRSTFLHHALESNDQTIELPEMSPRLSPAVIAIRIPL